MKENEIANKIANDNPHQIAGDLGPQNSSRLRLTSNCCRLHTNRHAEPRSAITSPQFCHLKTSVYNPTKQRQIPLSQEQTEKGMRCSRISHDVLVWDCTEMMHHT